MSNIISKKIYEQLFYPKIERDIVDIGEEFNHILQKNGEDIKDTILDKIESISGKFMLEDFHEAFEYKKKKGGYKNTRINCYIKRLNIYEDKFKNLRDIMINNIYQFMSFYTDILRDFSDDREHIFPNKNIKINHIVFDRGDTHNNGKSVVILYLNNESQLVYKPRCLESDILYYKLVQEFNYDNKLNIKTPKLYSFHTHGWQEFIDYTLCKTINEIETYYYNLGIHMFYTYMLRSNDIHYENIISHSNNPVIIDLETIMQGNINFQDKQISHNNSFFLNDSIFQTLLFDYATTFNGDGITFLGGTTNQTLSPRTEETLVDKDTDNMRYVYQEYYTKDSHNIPKYRGDFMEIHHFKEEVINGFKKAYMYTIKNKEKYKEIIYTYPTFNIRYVLKPTYMYATYIEYLKQSHLKDNYELYDILKRTNVFYNSNDIISNIEYKSLLNYDVPYFTANIDSKYIKSSISNENTVLNFFEKEPRKETLLRIDSLSLKDFEEQLYSLDLAIDGYKDNSSNKTGVNSIEKLNYKKDVCEEIEKVLPHNVNLSTLLNLRHNNNGKAIISPIGYNLYDGLGGISLLFKYRDYNNNNGSPFPLLEIDSSIKRMYELDKTNNYSIYHGKFSYFKYVYISHLISEGNQIADNLASLLKLVKEYNTHIAKNWYPIDYIGGLSGVTSLLIDYYASTGNKEILYTIEKYKNILISKYKIIKNDIFWIEDTKDSNMKPGLAHGTSGIALTLAKYINYIHEDKEIINIIERVLSYEDKFLSFKEQNIWCNGLSGILLARMLIKHYIPFLRVNYIEELTTIVYNDILKVNDRKSLCHGLHGNMLVLKAIESMSRNNTTYNLEQINEELRNHTMSYSWDSGFLHPNNNIGFFLGRSGQLFDIILSEEDYNLALYIMS